MTLASIIVRTFNEARYLPELLRTIERQTIRADERETIIVDSGSTDESLAIARQHDCRVVQIKPEEFSFGRSLNLGCDIAVGRHLVFISGHCVPVSQRWLEELIAPLRHGEAAVAYGRQIGGQETRFSEHQLFAKFFPPGDAPPPNAFFCNNANAAVLREEWAQFRFDETLTGLEDMHLGRRLVEAGRRIRYVPSASVYHHHHESWTKIKRRYEREAIALQKIMPEVHVHAGDALRYFTAAVVGDWAEALAQRCLFRRFWEITAFRFCQYYGTWRGNHIHRQLSRQAKEKYFYPK